ncbi:MAG: YebC/PmpR family DNA-binding transcriptional regulator [Gammaproteobacteria bacterium]|nr:YebC/PmpR family DNA-binding transcriptional regulator [Gammaproteobacteria bacterium]
MAGHSKWANIKHRKAAQDAKRGKLFTKLIREITVSAKLGGEDVDSNPRLRAAIDKALAANMSKDVVSRAIKRGAGGQDSEDYAEIRYEGYGPGGVAVMVDCLTDNRNRTVADVRHAFTKCGGNLGTDGSVAYLFTKVAQFGLPAGSDEERVMEVALESGADDVQTLDDGSLEVIADPENFESLRDALHAAGFEPEIAEVTMRASTSVDVDRDSTETLLRLLDMLEDLDDVQNVYSNAEFDDAVLAEIGD